MFKQLVTLSAILTLTISCSENSRTNPTKFKSIYGADDRLEIYQLPDNSPLREIARSTAIVLPKGMIQNTPDNDLRIVTERTLKESRQAAETPLCDDEPFLEQPDLFGLCTGFLYSEDTIITAAHCVPSDSSCSGIAVVFDAGYHSPNQDVRHVPSENYYTCKNILRSEQLSVESDIAWIQLDRAVTGRMPPNWTQVKDLDKNEELAVIGYPSSLPQKIATGGSVISVDNFSMKASLDAFAGSSGSPVVAKSSGKVAGVLIRGEEDYIKKNGCWKSKRCQQDGSDCEGEIVSIPALSQMTDL